MAQFPLRMNNGNMGKLGTRKLSPREYRIVQHFKLSLLEITPFKRLVVFDSRARGDATPDSDLDIFIEVPVLDAALRRQISRIAWEVSLDERVLISTFVITTTAINESPLGANPILRTIANEGIAV